MIGLKQFLLNTIARNFIVYHCVKEMKNFVQHRNFLNDMNQNPISSKLYQGATEYKISAHKFLRYNVHKILETYMQTDRQNFSNNGQIVFRTSKNI